MPTDEAAGEARQGASEAIRAAQGQSGEVARAVEAAALAAWRTRTIAREIGRLRQERTS